MYKITTDKGTYTCSTEDFVQTLTDLETAGEKIEAATRLFDTKQLTKDKELGKAVISGLQAGMSDSGFYK